MRAIAPLTIPLALALLGNGAFASPLGSVGEAVGGVGSAVGGTLGGAGDAVGAVGGAVGGPVGGVGEAAGGAISGIGGAASGAVDGVGGAVGSLDGAPGGNPAGPAASPGGSGNGGSPGGLGAGGSPAGLGGGAAPGRGPASPARATAQDSGSGPVRIASELLPIRGSSEGEPSWTRVDATGSVRLAPLTARFSVPAPVIDACRAAIAAAASAHGAQHVEVVGAGRTASLRGGGVAAPVEARILYARNGRFQVRQAQVSCRLDAAGRVVAAV
ncbi:MAG TPA: hypothetical protein VGU45_12940 [Microvirga sp.]|jgi:hypothetical protein|nr:hypothetical protein [Microvirga sp.]